MPRIASITYAGLTMKHTCLPGEVRQFEKRVGPEDLAWFEGQVVHAVCATFALAQAVEWASRLFVLEMKEADEEGVGIMLNINHKKPAFPGETILITATLQSIEGHSVWCSFAAQVGDRLVATGETGQKILKKEKLKKLLTPNPS
jgi:fluoroacetyl-CoA thioesterase